MSVLLIFQKIKDGRTERHTDTHEALYFLIRFKDKP